jgi:membrane protein YdbS with pleckstrin-like domain
MIAPYLSSLWRRPQLALEQVEIYAHIAALEIKQDTTHIRLYLMRLIVSSALILLAVLLGAMALMLWALHAGNLQWLAIIPAALLVMGLAFRWLGSVTPVLEFRELREQLTQDRMAFEAIRHRSPA